MFPKVVVCTHGIREVNALELCSSKVQLMRVTSGEKKKLKERQVCNGHNCCCLVENQIHIVCTKLPIQCLKIALVISCFLFLFSDGLRGRLQTDQSFQRGKICKTGSASNSNFPHSISFHSNSNFSSYFLFVVPQVTDFINRPFVLLQVSSIVQ